MKFLVHKIIVDDMCFRVFMVLFLHFHRLLVIVFRRRMLENELPGNFSHITLEAQTKRGETAVQQQQQNMLKVSLSLNGFNHQITTFCTRYEFLGKSGEMGFVI